MAHGSEQRTDQWPPMHVRGRSAAQRGGDKPTVMLYTPHRGHPPADTCIPQRHGSCLYTQACVKLLASTTSTDDKGPGLGFAKVPDGPRFPCELALRPDVGTHLRPFRSLESIMTIRIADGLPLGHDPSGPTTRTITVPEGEAFCHMTGVHRPNGCTCMPREGRAAQGWGPCMKAGPPPHCDGGPAC